MHDMKESKATYEGFFTVWKDADPDLKQAKAEYARQQ